MKSYSILILISMILFLSACQPQSPVRSPVAGNPGPALELTQDATKITNPEASSGPVQVEIGGKMIWVDKIITGPICNEAWSGRIYVSRDVQVAEWSDKDKPTFLKGCDFTVEPGTIIYVAAHNDMPYYKGCSCHTGGEATP
ncbi:MAG: hypothetical protein AB1345_02695 [Chloroflexota bacterium]